MIKLRKKEIIKIKGLAHYYSKSYEYAIKYLSELNKDAHAYEIIAYSYIHLKEYKLALDYTLKAIELGRDSAYFICYKIAKANSNAKDLIYAELKKGIEKHSAQAYVSMAKLCLNYSENKEFNIHIVEIIDSLEKGWKYSKPKEKGIIAMQIAMIYKSLCSLTQAKLSNFENFLKTKATKYLILANEYGLGSGQLNEEVFTSLSEQTKGKERKDIFNSLFEHFDCKSALYFGLLLIQNESNIIHASGEPRMLFGYGTSKGYNASGLLYGLIYGSHMPDSSFEYNKAKDLLRIIYHSKDDNDAPTIIRIPTTVKETYLSLINEYDSQFNYYLKELKTRIYDSK